MSVAFVFPGQGSFRAQPTGVWGGHVAEEVLDEVTRGLGRPARAVLEDPTAGQRTADAQPAILTASLLAWRVVSDRGIRPDYVAGHSLGEITAAVAAEAISIEDAARVVAVRGRAMGEACHRSPGTMLALLRLDPDVIGTLVAEIDGVVVANDNAPGQVVVAGDVDAVTRAGEAARAAGGRALTIEVEGAFHSPAMRPAREPLEDLLSTIEVRDPTVPIVSGTTARPLRRGDDVRRAILDGLLSPVRWREVQYALADAGVDTLVELGPGGVLAGLARRTVGELETVTVAGPEDLQRLADLAGVASR